MADEWKSFAQDDPYYSVLTEERFRGAPDQEMLDEFFASGEEDFEWIVGAARSIDPDFAPRSFLDYGCGVGRILLAAAARCEQVTGVDIAPAMLERAERHAKERGLSNVTLRTIDETVAGSFDLVNCYLVLQHVPPREGERIVEMLIECVSAGAFLSVHVLHSRPGSVVKRIGRSLRASSPVVNTVANRLRGTRGGYMQMNVSAVPPLFRRLRAAGFTEARVRFTDHAGMEGVWIVAGPRKA